MRDTILLVVSILVLCEVSYLLMKTSRTSIKAKNRAILVDTSVLMDGRIVTVAKTGFIGGTLVVPRSVIGELQFLADHADADKRARARYGLDVVTKLQALERIDVELLQDGSHAKEGVDERLLKLAKQHDAVVMTLDYNLNKVAAVEGIEVLNLNELAQSIRMEHLPGEHVEIELIQKGQDPHQGVGYLGDGTMVVVDQANALIGKTIAVEIVRNLQTAAGRMIFAKKFDEKPAKTKIVKHEIDRPSGRAILAVKPKKTNNSRTRDNIREVSKKVRQSATRSVKSSSSTEKTSGNAKVSRSNQGKTHRKKQNHEQDLINLVNNQ